MTLKNNILNYTRKYIEDRCDLIVTPLKRISHVLSLRNPHSQNTHKTQQLLFIAML